MSNALREKGFAEDLGADNEVDGVGKGALDERGSLIDHSRLATGNSSGWSRG